MKHLLVLSLAFVAVSCGTRIVCLGSYQWVGSRKHTYTYRGCSYTITAITNPPARRASDFTKHFTGSLLVRFGILGDYFLKLPVTIPEALQEGWEQTPRPPGPMPSLVMYCHETKLVCVLYDDTENAAGMQVAFPVNDFKSPIHDMEVTGFSKWTPIPNQETYWAIQQYFVNEEYLALSAEERNANRDSEKLLQLDGVWLTGINKEITKVANDYDVFIKDPTFTKQACIPLMGRHFYHNMTKSLECNAEKIYPWFPMMHTNNLVATGLMVFGQFAENKVKDFFERPAKAAVQVIAGYKVQDLQ